MILIFIKLDYTVIGSILFPLGILMHLPELILTPINVQYKFHKIVKQVTD